MKSDIECLQERTCKLNNYVLQETLTMADYEELKKQGLSHPRSFTQVAPLKQSDPDILHHDKSSNCFFFSPFF